MSATGMPSALCFKMNAFWASENFEVSSLCVPASRDIGAKKL
jgi:hypothetical protein